ncbi:MAG: metal-dependent hydrolase [Hydrogenibacillus sp.]|nr:metal-dependent hydrolase [Hydrogenibacillus sp.]
MEIRYHGHATVELVIGDAHVWIDPYLSDNPLAKVKADAVRADYIVLTHGHSDHTGDALALAERHKATIIATFELASYFGAKGANVHPMNLGGAHRFPFGTVRLVQAFHSSSLIEEDGRIVYLGMPAGAIIEAEGTVLYHAGDTALFGDMKLIGELYRPRIAFLPIGDNFTMGPEEAVVAAEWLGRPRVIPIHYNTFPVIVQDVDAFVRNLKERGIEGLALSPGESLSV